MYLRLMNSRTTLPFLLFFLSGFTGLVYQVLWMKELRILFGSTTFATSTTLCAFFLGLSVGSSFFGKRVKNYRSSLRVYGVLELAVAVSALLYFLLLKIHFAFYPFLFQNLSELSVVFVATKFVLGVTILFPPAFFMGGTLPLLSDYIVTKGKLGTRHIAYLYATNTLGAATGVLSAGFFLPHYFGFKGAYGVAIFLTAIVGLVAILSDSKNGSGPESKDQSHKANDLTLSKEEARKSLEIKGLAWLSGFLTLGLQVFWTTMFSQTLQNSVYTFSLIVLTFLVALATGSLIAGFLAKKDIAERVVLSGTLLLSALLVAATPFLFQYVTGGMGKVGGKSGFFDYLSLATLSISSVLFLPTVVMGIVFPFLLKSTEALPDNTGALVGMVAAWNTAGAIFGALVAGFLCLPFLGLWSSIQFTGVLFALASLYLCLTSKFKRGTLFSLGTLLLLGLFLDPSELPLVKVYPKLKKEKLVEVWEGTDAVVAVVERNNSIRMKVNNFYVLGSSGARRTEEMQTHVPLMIHPQPKDVFYLGLGTGITAGAALRHPVDSVKATEILPEVVEASRKYFKPYLNGLFESEKAEVLAEDGRNYIRGTDEHFDVIVGDLFLPWKAGVGNLYSSDHFQMVKKRLRPKGIYSQWIPLYQVSKEEFSIIANTMLQVFSRVTVWRRDFGVKEPVIALVGHADESPLEWEAILARSDSRPEGDNEENSFLGHYCGNLSEARSLVADSPINTDDFPVIEYLSPRTHRNRRINSGLNQASWFTNKPLEEFFEKLINLSPPATDPYLRNVPESGKGMVAEGLRVFKLEGSKRPPS